MSGGLKSVTVLDRVSSRRPIPTYRNHSPCNKSYAAMKRTRSAQIGKPIAVSKSCRSQRAATGRIMSGGQPAGR